MAAKLRVATAKLNLREAPGTGSAIIVELEEGAALSLAGAEPVEVEGGRWINVVTADGRTGWVHSGFVEEVEAERLLVTADGLNVRGGPGVEHGVLVQVAKGDVLVATGEPEVTLESGARWLQVTTAGGVMGWVNRKFTEVVAAGGGTGSAPSGGAVGGQLAWGAKVSAEFRERVRGIAARLGFEPDLLMAAMAFESGRTFSPSVKNRVSGATGLIQFMPATARGLGTTVEELAAMSAESQLVFVEKYLAPFKGRIHRVEDLYMSILFPVAVSKPVGAALFTQGTIEYEQNRGLDADGDGVITKGEAAAKVVEQLEIGRRPENVG